MSRILTPDLCIIGAGSAGLSVAAGAAQMGVDTVLIEANRMGGDCLNTGCVPSKSMIKAARVAHEIRNSGRFGVNGHEPTIDFPGVHRHVHGVIDAIAPHDSQERFESLGCTVIRARARFTGPDRLVAGDTEVKARRFVIATGSSAATPPIPGLETVPYLTNETVFDRTERPEHLVVIGGGPIGTELAQAHARLGSKVTLIERETLLPKDDPELVAVVRHALVADGIRVIEGAGVVAVSTRGNGVALEIDRDGQRETVVGTDLLIAAGRRANTAGLDLDKAGVDTTDRGIRVDDRLRTSNRRIYAMGDVVGGLQFTHMAGYHASIIIKNALFRMPAKVDTRAFPWVTYAEPELAHVGLSEARVRQRGDAHQVLRWTFCDNDRARAEAETTGMVKVMVRPNGRILGASIVGPQAGELIQVWVLAIAQNLKIGAIATMVAPYPTLGEVNKRVAGSFYTPKLFSPRTRGLVRLLSRFG